MKTKSLTESPAAKARWMVVDDDANMLQIVATLLAAASQAEVCRFHSGAEALEAFTAAPETFQFVITDLDMPGMSGVELCRRLRAQSPSLEVLLATGSGIVTRDEVQQFGFCGLLKKPFGLTQLRGALTTSGILKSLEDSPADHAPVCMTA